MLFGGRRPRRLEPRRRGAEARGGQHQYPGGARDGAQQAHDDTAPPSTSRHVFLPSRVSQPEADCCSTQEGQCLEVQVPPITRGRLASGVFQHTATASITRRRRRGPPLGGRARWAGDRLAPERRRDPGARRRGARGEERGQRCLRPRERRGRHRDGQHQQGEHEERAPLQMTEEPGHLSQSNRARGGRQRRGHGLGQPPVISAASCRTSAKRRSASAPNDGCRDSRARVVAGLVKPHRKRASWRGSPSAPRWSAESPRKAS